jgi:hypothetical protein
VEPSKTRFAEENELGRKFLGEKKIGLKRRREIFFVT